jgi:protein-tyrosine-phosphatase
MATHYTVLFLCTDNFARSILLRPFLSHEGKGHLQPQMALSRT